MAKSQPTSKVRRSYQFIQLHQDQYAVKTMCRLLNVTRSGYYAWLKEPISNRTQEDVRLLRLIRASFVASHGIYGAPRVFLDLREAGETCSKHRVARLMRINGIRAAYGYGTRRYSVSKPSTLIPNSLLRNFTVSKRNTAWVTDITYIRTWQGLAISCGGGGPLLTKDSRVGNQTDNRPRARPRRGHHGRPPPSSQANTHTLGPRVAIRK